MFNKKKIKEEVKPDIKEYAYNNWKDDFGFLLLIMEKKKTISKEFYIKTFMEQLQSSTDYLKDDDILPIIDRTIKETYSMLSDSYKKLLIDKYFGSNEGLVSFITEDIYTDLAIESINTNSAKIRHNFIKNSINSITDMNNKKDI